MHDVRIKQKSLSKPHTPTLTLLIKANTDSCEPKHINIVGRAKTLVLLVPKPSTFNIAYSRGCYQLN